ncbi:hypothetical protein C8A03DRAFT_15862 [Achaetomium macrosporum]|uniref:J domain-containing protein n=1 Tax=Achaetomium macrosporum TaxID=79813 RepID=A0AAN7C8Z2_9PEZI|nr:hypothetical protein C8A03DRAFT_15862 [Achaetomium macrosporum]
MLLAAAEAAFMMLATLSPLMAEFLLSACEFGLSIVSEPALDWSLALGGMLGSFVFFHFIVGPIDATKQRQQNPYTLLGVTTASSHSEITDAYYKMMDNTRRHGHLDLVEAGLDLFAYREAYETLTDRLQRCVYHRDVEIPDWYGVPKLCWGELAIDTLQCAKTATQAWTGPEDAFAKMPASIHTLRKRFRRSQPALIPAVSTLISSITEGQLSAGLGTMLVNTVRDWLGFFKQGLVTLKVSASALFTCLRQWVESNPHYTLTIAVLLLLLSILTIMFLSVYRLTLGTLLAFVKVMPMLIRACFKRSSLALWRLEFQISDTIVDTIVK